MTKEVLRDPFHPLDGHLISRPFEIKKIRDLIIGIEPGFACGQHNSTGSGVVHLRPMNIDKLGRINFSEKKYVDRNASGKRVKESDVLFNNTNSPELVGKTALIKQLPQELAFSNHMTRISFDENLILPSFAAMQLQYFFQSRYFRHKCTNHVSQASVSTNVLCDSVPFILPPIYLQEYIVAKIDELFDELDKGFESLNTAKRKLEQYRQSVLKQAFEGELTAKWREKNKDKIEPTEKLLERINRERDLDYQRRLSAGGASHKGRARPRKPKTLKSYAQLEHQVNWSYPTSWLGGHIGFLTYRPEYGTSSKSSQSGDVPVLRMGNLQNSTIDWSDLKFTSDKVDIKKYQLTKGDVLFNRTNSPELVGKTAIYVDNREAIFAGYLIRLNQLRKVCDAHYLNYYLNSPFARNHCAKVKTDGVNQSNINGQKLTQFPIPIPTIEEQRKITSILEQCINVAKHLEKQVTSQIQRSASLRQSILKSAFSGKLLSSQIIYQSPDPPHISASSAATIEQDQLL